MRAQKRIANLKATLKKARGDNRGFSLVELIIASAILAIVLAGVTSFMIIGTRNYSNANNEVTVQQEVQQAVNQIADAIIDASWSVGLDPKFVTPGENTKMLAVYNGIPDDPAHPSAPMKVEAGREKNYVFYWKDKGETIEDPNDATKTLKLGGLWYTEFSASELEIGPDAVTCLLADNVTEFVVDSSESLSKNVVGINVQVIRGNRIYKATSNVTIRNKVMFNAYVPEYHDEDLPTISISAPLVLYLEPGDSYNLTANVSGENVDTLSYHWEDSAGNTLASGSTGISIDKDHNNALSIGGNLLDAASYRSEHVVFAVSDAEDSHGHPARSMPVRIRVKRTREVRIDAVPDTVKKGETITLTGTIAGDYLNRTCSKCGDDADVYELSVSGSYSFKYSEDGGTTWKNCGSSTPFTVGAPTYSGSSFSVPVTLNSSVKTGNYIIRAYSAHSVNKNGGYDGLTYSDRVRGEVMLNTKGGPTRPRRASIGRLVYGSSADLAYGVFGEYANLYLAIQVFNADGEWVRTFLMDQPGNNMRLDADYFGIDWTKDYIVSIELFDKANYDHWGFQNEYLNHLDENMLYNGTKLNMIYGFEGYMTPPTVNLRYDGAGGTLYENRPFTMAAVKIHNEGFSQVYVSPCSGMEQESYEYVGGVVQRKQNGNWVDFGYINMKPTGQGGNKAFTRSYGQFYPTNGNKSVIGDLRYELFGREWKLKMTKSFDRSATRPAVGEYRVIPYIVYKLGTMNKNSYLRDRTFYTAGYEDKNEYSLECPQSTYYFSVVDNPSNYNVKELFTYVNNNMKKGDIYFPTPNKKAEFEKYFKFDDKVSTTKEYTTESSFEYSADGKQYSAIFNKIKCTYDGKGKYTLQFFYTAKNYDWNRSAYDVETATYTWDKSKGGDSWTKTTTGPLDPNGPELGSTIKDMWVFWGTPKYEHWWKGNVYVPLPWEDDFKNNIKIGPSPLSPSLTLEYTDEFTFRQGSDNKIPDGGMVFSKAIFTYDSLSNKYYVEIYYPYMDSTYGKIKEIKAGKWEATDNKSISKQWTRVAGDDGKGLLDADLDRGIRTFSFASMKGLNYGKNWGITQGDASYPLPTEEGFPFEATTGTQTKTQSLKVSHHESWGTVSDTRSFTITCTYNPTTEKYTLEMITKHDNGTTNIKTKYEASKDETNEWKKID